LSAGEWDVLAPSVPLQPSRGALMRTYYFDVRDGVPVRDHVGLRLPTTAAAIEHSRKLARQFSHRWRSRNDELVISVLDESGAELHREKVCPAE
jgi:hypothetical protein